MPLNGVRFHLVMIPVCDPGKARFESGRSPQVSYGVRCHSVMMADCESAKAGAAPVVHPKWPLRPLAKSPGFHPGKAGSIPAGVTNQVIT